jgi:hypothetical protein
MSKYFKPCTCGFNGRGYCPAFEGDSSLQNAINYFKKVAENNMQCAPNKGISALCFKDDEDILENYYKYFAKFTEYSQTALVASGTTGCYKDVVMENYWTAFNFVKKKHSSYGSELALAVIALIAAFI